MFVISQASQKYMSGLNTQLWVQCFEQRVCGF